MLKLKMPGYTSAYIVKYITNIKLWIDLFQTYWEERKIMLFIDPTPLVKWNLHVPCRLNFFLKKKLKYLRYFFLSFFWKGLQFRKIAFTKILGQVENTRAFSFVLTTHRYPPNFVVSHFVVNFVKTFLDIHVNNRNRSSFVPFLWTLYIACHSMEYIVSKTFIRRSIQFIVSLMRPGELYKTLSKILQKPLKFSWM